MSGPYKIHYEPVPGIPYCNKKGAIFVTKVRTEVTCGLCRGRIKAEDLYSADVNKFKKTMAF